MQGFHFTKDNNGFLEMDWVEAKRLNSPYTRLPYVNYQGIVRVNSTKVKVYFKLWSDVTG